MRLSSLIFQNLLYSLLLLLLLGGCGLISVAYNNADTVVYWYLDDYFDFTSEQRILYDQKIQHIHAWHRRIELPKYAALCSEAAQRVETGLDHADLAWLETALTARFNALVDYSAADLADLLATIEPAQLDVLDKRLSKSNAKFIRENISGTVAERDRKRSKETLARIEDWIGALNPDQKTSVLAMLKSMPRMAEHRYAQRIARQKILREIIATQSMKDKSEAALKHWLINWESGRTPEHERIWALWLEQNRQLILELTAMLTPQQRVHLVNKLRDYAKDFNNLHNQRR